MTPGVFTSKKKDGTTYYRVSITYHGKHISLGSYDDANTAASAYAKARRILDNTESPAPLPLSLHARDATPLPFDKLVILLNFRDNDIYFKTPIYLCKKFFIYYLTPDHVLKFDADDLFYYSTHRIMARNGYLFVNDYGSQTSILARYGIPAHSVAGRDYAFANGDSTDFRYGNIIIINRYHGVQVVNSHTKTCYRVKIHVNGDYLVGTYPTEEEAAIAYNKAANVLRSNGFNIAYPANYLEELSNIEYAKIYHNVRISRKLLELKKAGN
jgi:hypothetical protein